MKKDQDSSLYKKFQIEITQLIEDKINSDQKVLEEKKIQRTDTKRRVEFLKQEISKEVSIKSEKTESKEIIQSSNRSNV